MQGNPVLHLQPLQQSYLLILPHLLTFASMSVSTTAASEKHKMNSSFNRFLRESFQRQALWQSMNLSGSDHLLSRAECLSLKKKVMIARNSSFFASRSSELYSSNTRTKNVVLLRPHGAPDCTSDKGTTGCQGLTCRQFHARYMNLCLNISVGPLNLPNFYFFIHSFLHICVYSTILTSWKQCSWIVYIWTSSI